jgi:hypothetical protein
MEALVGQAPKIEKLILFSCIPCASAFKGFKVLLVEHAGEQLRKPEFLYGSD